MYMISDEKLKAVKNIIPITEQNVLIFQEYVFLFVVMLF